MKEHKEVPSTLSKTEAQSFWQRVDQGSSCWEWRAGKNGVGYGIFYVNGSGLLAHRISYALMFGLIDKSLCVCHKCDNPACVNPEHLFLGTRGDNNRDSVAKGRANRPKGQDAPNSALKEGEVRLIFRLLTTGNKNPYHIAPMFSISPRAVYSIREGRCWNWLTQAKKG